jgi:hypothetical protein
MGQKRVHHIIPLNTLPQQFSFVMIAHILSLNVCESVGKLTIIVLDESMLSHAKQFRESCHGSDVNANIVTSPNQNTHILGTDYLMLQYV